MTTFAIIKDALLVLMEGLPKGIDFNDVMNIFLNIEGVVRVHNLRIWALTLDKTALSAHIAISKMQHIVKVKNYCQMGNNSRKIRSIFQKSYF